MDFEDFTGLSFIGLLILFMLLLSIFGTLAMFDTDTRTRHYTDVEEVRELSNGNLLIVMENETKEAKAQDDIVVECDYESGDLVLRNVETKPKWGWLSLLFFVLVLIDIVIIVIWQRREETK